MAGEFWNNRYQIIMTEKVETNPNPVAEFYLNITRTSYDKATGEMRFRAVASDVDEDSYGDNMTVSLFSDFLGRIESGEKPPEDYCSEFWAGGMPYLSLSHYPDLDGEAVPGIIESVYVDGKCLKSKGVFYDDNLGRACFRAINEDLYGESEFDEKVRISIAFLDYSHRHKSNGYSFERKELSDICPECIRELVKGEYAGKSYLKGHLIHEALTRVPVNVRTSMEVDRSMSEIKTRKQDTASIVGDELAELIDEKNRLVGKSELDGLVVKSEENSEEVIEEEVAQEVSEEPEEVIEEVAEEKSEASIAEVERGGPTSITDMIATQEALAEMNRMQDLFWMLSDVVWNIFYSDDVEDKKAAVKSAIEEFKGLLEKKAMVELALAMENKPDRHPLDKSFETLRSAFDEVQGEFVDAPAEERLQLIQDSYAQLGEVIRSTVAEEESGQEEAPTEVGVDLVAALSEVMQPVAQKLDLLLQQNQQPQVNQVRSEIPQRRSIVPPQLPQSMGQEQKKSSLSDMIRKSVGLQN